jgi:hypothetical protein
VASAIPWVCTILEFAKTKRAIQKSMPTLLGSPANKTSVQFYVIFTIISYLPAQQHPLTLYAAAALEARHPEEAHYFSSAETPVAYSLAFLCPIYRQFYPHALRKGDGTCRRACSTQKTERQIIADVHEFLFGDVEADV